MKQISKYFINGLIVIIPIAITIFVINYVFAFTENLLGKYLPVKIPGLALIVFFVAVVIIGWLSSLWLLKSIISYGEKLVGSIPIVKFIYSNVKQFSKAIFESQKLFQNAVLVSYPYPGSKVVGFIINDLSEPLASKFTEKHVCVFIPMSLNVTSGINIIVPEKDIIILDVNSESALQYVVTAGLVMPKYNDSNSPNGSSDSSK